MSASERRDYLRYLEDRRDYLRDQYAELDDPERATVFWAGDRNAFGQPMGGGMDPETREFVDACPGQVFIDAAGETVDLTREPPLDEGVMAPSADYALAMPGGGRLVGERDTNPQWLGAGPAALRWVGEGGRGGACLRTAAKLHHRS
jgi:hypothetical protein